MSSLDRFLRRAEVCRLTGMSRYLIDMLEDCGAFPKRMQVGHRNVYWSETEVSDFLSQLKNQRALTGAASGNDAAAPDSAQHNEPPSNCAASKHEGGQK